MDIVDNFLVDMIKRWPTLRQTRNDALYALASQTPDPDFANIRWNDDGNIEFIPDCGEFYRETYVPVEEREDIIRKKARVEETAEGSVARKVAEQGLASDLLYHRREAAKEQFTRTNAHLIVGSHDHNFVNTVPAAKAFQFLAEIPENANPLWIEAFVGLAHDLMFFKYPAGKFDSMAADYAERYQTDLAAAKKEAQAFLIRVKGSDVEKRELAKKTLEAEVAKLVKKAADAGLTLEATIA